jgi:hypothetical protein
MVADPTGYWGGDYYVLILAGRYGSPGPNGVGYTGSDLDKFRQCELLTPVGGV